MKGVDRVQKTARATKKQHELFVFIDAFIRENNYSPSYREIMSALGYKSVSTVAIHVDGLIGGGYLRKKDNSARSIEVVRRYDEPDAPRGLQHERWLVGVVEKKIASGELHEREIGLLRDALEILEISDFGKNK